ncbi:uncharacterized protein VDAG_09776 [Verticillium dahliae VdLs.17]|uniref:Rhodopsin domain-containing protein n=1 Tax=Verticillium dahliae (strain VdLs.17 / ATCC MYA-4575 / FGSC 10137) TaxID=498257 RepID=G2XHM2_VERDV|nr:uncharacterized protein VDAG_09776 [Verticillium dahliae VdLs.17]EGY19316.1 hypothetical protein VDAG_09776 [Verticillium dahliae VdLs.17]
MSSNTLDNTALLATGICMVILTSAVFGFRLAISLLERRQLAWEDGFLSAALEDLAAGRIPMYPTIMDDSLRIQKTFFVTTSGLWISLWLVKASLLAVYKRLMVNLRLFTILWWTLAGAITSSMLSCSSMKAWFTAGACGTQRDIEAAYISLWYSYAVDIFTDILVMLLPLGLIRNLQMKMSRKLSIAGLFCLGWVCVAVSTIRVAYLGRNAVEGSSFKQPATSWLALWGIVESAIAVIIGCGPGLFRKAKAISKSRNNYYNMGVPGSSKPKSKSAHGNDMDMQAYRNTVQINNDTSSQEELVNMRGRDKIVVTQSVMVSSSRGD